MTEDLKICVFAYNFPHKKTQEGLYKLILNNIDIKLVILADPIKLNFTSSKTRVGLREMKYEDPKLICERFKIPYIVLPHNESDDFLSVLRPDLGIILGSRIIKKNIIDKFKIGILNLHPGILPDNRGLDNIKWAISKNIKQGVTAHLIDSSIDRGYLIEKRLIEIFEDDTFTDIFLRIQNTELELMISSIKKINHGFIFDEILGSGTYFKPMTDEEDDNMLSLFEDYKKNYKL
jgi:methionyl-tRNA formyltransferase